MNPRAAKENGDRNEIETGMNPRAESKIEIEIGKETRGPTQ